MTSQRQRSSASPSTSPACVVAVTRASTSEPCARPFTRSSDRCDGRGSHRLRHSANARHARSRVAAPTSVDPPLGVPDRYRELSCTRVGVSMTSDSLDPTATPPRSICAVAAPKRRSARRGCVFVLHERLWLPPDSHEPPEVGRRGRPLLCAGPRSRSCDLARSAVSRGSSAGAPAPTHRCSTASARAGSRPTNVVGVSWSAVRTTGPSRVRSCGMPPPPQVLRRLSRAIVSAASIVLRCAGSSALRRPPGSSSRESCAARSISPPTRAEATPRATWIPCGWRTIGADTVHMSRRYGPPCLRISPPVPRGPE